MAVNGKYQLEGGSQVIVASMGARNARVFVAWNAMLNYELLLGISSSFCALLPVILRPRESAIIRLLSSSFKASLN